MVVEHTLKWYSGGSRVFERVVLKYEGLLKNFGHAHFRLNFGMGTSLLSMRHGQERERVEQFCSTAVLLDFVKLAVRYLCC